MMRSPRSVPFLAAASLALAACEPSTPPEAPKATPARPPPSLAPFVVDAERGALPIASGLRRGAVLVDYDATGLRVLPDCTADATYTFSGSAPEPVRKVFSGALAAELPLTGSHIEARVETELSRGALLVLEGVISGTYTLAHVPSRAELRGACAQATHVMVSAMVGAFRLGLDRKSTRESVVGPVGAAAIETRPFQMLVASGERPACEAASPGSTTPPRGCDALVRIALDPLEP